MVKLVFRMIPVKLIFINQQELFRITVIQFQSEKCIIDMLSDTFLPNTSSYLTHLLVFGLPKVSPNTVKIRQNIKKDLAEKCLITFFIR